MQSPIANDWPKLYIDGHSEPKLVPKILLHVSFWEPHNIMVSPQEEGGLNEAREAENNITISDSTIWLIFHPKLRIFLHGKISGVVVIDA